MSKFTGRTAVCSCGNTIASDNPHAAFVQYRGPGSKWTENCECGYAKSAHDPAYMAKLDKTTPDDPKRRRTVVELGRCTGFVNRKPHEFDSYYCGCRGWD